MNIRRMRDARSCRGVVAGAPAASSPARAGSAPVDSPPRPSTRCSLDARVVPLTYPSRIPIRGSNPCSSRRPRPARGDDPRDERGGHHEGERTRQERERRRTASRAHSPTERPTLRPNHHVDESVPVHAGDDGGARLVSPERESSRACTSRRRERHRSIRPRRQNNLRRASDPGRRTTFGLARSPPPLVRSRVRALLPPPRARRE